MDDYFFEQMHLDIFELSADNLTHENLKRHWRKFCLKHHPDNGGMNSFFVEAGAAYQAALIGLRTFAVWHSVNPSLTLSDTIRPRPTAPVDPFRGDSNAAQPASPEPAIPPAPDLAPSFHAATNCKLRSSLEEALSQIDFEFMFTWSEIAQTLKQTPVGQSAIFYQTGCFTATSHSVSWNVFQSTV